MMTVHLSGSAEVEPLPVYALRLKELREKAGLTQQELATRAGLAIGGVRKVEQGDREPSWSTLVALADALGVTLDAFRQDAVDRETKIGRPIKPKVETPKRPRGRPPLENK